MQTNTDQPTISGEPLQSLSDLFKSKKRRIGTLLRDHYRNRFLRRCPRHDSSKQCIWFRIMYRKVCEKRVRRLVVTVQYGKFRRRGQKCRISAKRKQSILEVQDGRGNPYDETKGCILPFSREHPKKHAYFDKVKNILIITKSPTNNHRRRKRINRWSWRPKKYLKAKRAEEAVGEKDEHTKEPRFVVNCVSSARYDKKDTTPSTERETPTIALDCSDVSEDDIDKYLQEKDSLTATVDRLTTDEKTRKDDNKVKMAEKTERNLSTSDIESDEDFGDSTPRNGEPYTEPLTADSEDLCTDLADELDELPEAEFLNTPPRPKKLPPIQTDEPTPTKDELPYTSPNGNPVAETEQSDAGIDSDTAMKHRPNRKRSATPLRDRIREQLSFLRMGKLKEPFLAESIGTVVPKPSNSSKLFALPVECQSPGAIIHRTYSRSERRSVEIKPARNAQPSDRTSSAGRSNFIDALYNKFNPNQHSAADLALRDRPIADEDFTIDEHTEPLMPSTVERPIADDDYTKEEPPAVVPLNAAKLKMRMQNIAIDDITSDMSSDTSEFHGFSETSAAIAARALTISKVVTLVPTAVVKPPANVHHSAFVSEALDTFMKENALENVANVVSVAVKTRDEKSVYPNPALVTADSAPPPMSCPPRPLHVARPRTLAEKRAQLAGNENDIRVRMLDNESHVYRALRRRGCALGVGQHQLPQQRVQQNNYITVDGVAALQEQRLPFTRHCWIAASWLVTQPGQFYYQNVQMACGSELNVFGGRGGHEEVLAWSIPPSELAIEKGVRLPDTVVDPRRCRSRCRPLSNVRIGNIDEFMLRVYPPKPPKPRSNSTSDGSGLGDVRTTNRHHPYRSGQSICHSAAFRPCPLSHKRLPARSTSADIDLGPLQVYRMPAVQLEVWPHVDDPLPDLVRPYLKSVLPFKSLTEQWANFAVSTLQKTSQRPKVQVTKTTTRRGRVVVRNSYVEKDVDNDEHDENNKQRNQAKAPNTPRASFIFDIPYANDQNLLLVRKRRERKAVLSTRESERIPEITEEYATQFDRHVNTDDAVAVAVANVLHGMLDSVAISCAENGVAVDDPEAVCLRDEDNADTNVRSGQKRKAGERSAAGSETFRKEKTGTCNLRRELKRLNATIIDNYVAPVKENCEEAFCALGCICDSLAVQKNHAQHCRNIRCMFECKCPKKSLSVMESRNNNIEQIRHRANARLAKEEREFRATVVLSEDRTIYIPNSENVGKRNKRMPKRYHDAEPSDAAVSSAPPSPTRARPSSANSISHGGKRARFTGGPGTALVASVEAAAAAGPDDVCLQYELNRMRHCAVNLTRMPVAVATLEPWCMVHCLYKCYCRLRSTAGKPFEFNDTSSDAEIEMATSATDERRSSKQPAVVAESYAPAGRANAAEDSAEQLEPPAAKRRQYTFDREESVAAAVVAYPTPANANKTTSSERALTPTYLMKSLLKTVNSEAAASEPQDIDTAGRRHTKRTQYSSSARTRIVEHEPMPLDRVRREHRRLRDIERTLPGLLDLLNNRVRHCAQNWPRPGSENEPQNSDDESENNDTNNTQRSTANNTPTPVSSEASAPMPRTSDWLPGAAEYLQPNAIGADAARSSDSPASLHQHAIQFASFTSMPEGGSSSGDANQAHKLRYFNYCVNRTMQQIKEAQLHTQHIRNPGTKTLNCVQWNRFIELYFGGEVFVWVVRLATNETILGLTVQNVVPLIPDTLCVMNVRAVQCPDQLPLLAQMLVRRDCGERYNQLAVLMSGRSNYWKIVSMIHSHRPYLTCEHRIKPSPRTYPQLALKIRNLFQYLTTRHLRQTTPQADGQDCDDVLLEALTASIGADKDTTDATVPQSSPRTSGLSSPITTVGDYTIARLHEPAAASIEAPVQRAEDTIAIQEAAAVPENAGQSSLAERLLSLNLTLGPNITIQRIPAKSPTALPVNPQPQPAGPPMVMLPPPAQKPSAALNPPIKRPTPARRMSVCATPSRRLCTAPVAPVNVTTLQQPSAPPPPVAQPVAKRPPARRMSVSTAISRPSGSNPTAQPQPQIVQSANRSGEMPAHVFFQRRISQLIEPLPMKTKHPIGRPKSTASPNPATAAMLPPPPPSAPPQPPSKPQATNRIQSLEAPPLRQPPKRAFPARRHSVYVSTPNTTPSHPVQQRPFLPPPHTSGPIYQQRASPPTRMYDLHEVAVATSENRGSTNIAIVDPEGIDNVNTSLLPPPEPGTTTRWFMLNLQHNDFTHILVPGWATFLTFARIWRCLALSRLHRKPVRLSPKGLALTVYTVPTTADKLFFGPYHAASANLVLLRQHPLDERKVYRLVMAKTTGTWLVNTPGSQATYAHRMQADTIDGSCDEDLPDGRSGGSSSSDAVPSAPAQQKPPVNVLPAAVVQPNAQTRHVDEDDDCMIIEQPIDHIDLADDENEVRPPTQTNVPQSVNSGPNPTSTPPLLFRLLAPNPAPTNAPATKEGQTVTFTSSVQMARAATTISLEEIIRNAAQTLISLSPPKATPSSSLSSSSSMPLSSMASNESTNGHVRQLNYTAGIRVPPLIPRTDGAVAPAAPAPAALGQSNTAAAAVPQNVFIWNSQSNLRLVPASMNDSGPPNRPPPSSGPSQSLLRPTFHQLNAPNHDLASNRTPPPVSITAVRPTPFSHSGPGTLPSTRLSHSSSNTTTRNSINGTDPQVIHTIRGLPATTSITLSPTKANDPPPTATPPPQTPASLQSPNSLSSPTPSSSSCHSGGIHVSSDNLKNIVAANIHTRLPDSLVITTCIHSPSKGNSPSGNCCPSASHTQGASPAHSSRSASPFAVMSTPVPAVPPPPPAPQRRSTMTSIISQLPSVYITLESSDSDESNPPPPRQQQQQQRQLQQRQQQQRQPQQQQQQRQPQLQQRQPHKQQQMQPQQQQRQQRLSTPSPSSTPPLPLATITPVVQIRAGTRCGPGFLISDAGASMGRIRAQIIPSGLCFQFYDAANWTKPMTVSTDANVTIARYIRNRVYGCVPRSTGLLLHWKFVYADSPNTTSDRLRNYRWQNEHMLNMDCVVTHTGRFDMKAPDFDQQIETLDDNTQQCVLLLRVAWMCRIESEVAQMRPFGELMERCKRYAEKMRAQEAHLQQVQLELAGKIRKNQKRLNKLQRILNRNANRKK